MPFACNVNQLGQQGAGEGPMGRKDERTRAGDDSSAIMVNKKSTWQERKLAKVRSALAPALSRFLHWGVPTASGKSPFLGGMAFPRGANLGQSETWQQWRQQSSSFRDPALLWTLINNVFIFRSISGGYVPGIPSSLSSNTHDCRLLLLLLLLCDYILAASFLMTLGKKHKLFASK